MTTTLPTVRRMVMFKHGVAYLERSGPADGPFELSFDKDEMNDVLKSLAAWVEKGDARVTSIAFEKPEDPEEVLARRRLVLEPTSSLLGLFAAFRGRRVRAELASGDVEGEVIGFEDVPVDRGATDRRVVLRAAPEKIVLFPLREVRSVSLLEGPSRADLELLVDRTRAATAGDNRIVKVGLVGKAEDLRVAYVVPAPVWRVTYRFARTGDSTVLLAWGIVHNPADEDLDDVELTLTTGQPVSFVIDLYHPKRVHRVEVEESSRALSAPPTQYGAAMPMGGAGMAGFGPPPGAPMAAPAPAPAVRMAKMGDAFGATMDRGEPPAAHVERGELFEYRVAQKVSIKRGGSAMVPLLVSEIAAKKERIWRQGSPPAPDLVLTFPNETGAVLEEGAATIYDDNVYAGEAMVPYRVRGAEVKLAFAKDLAVRCKRDAVTNRIVSRLALGKQALVEEVRWEEKATLAAENDHAEAIEVIFETPKIHGRSFAEGSPTPFESTSAHHRLRANVEARGRVVVTVTETWLEHRRIEYESIQPGNLEWWLKERLLDGSTHAALAPITAHWDRAREIDRRLADLERERGATYERQRQLSQQLGVLKEGGPEGELRLRYARELAASQDEVNRIEAEMRTLTSERDASRVAATEGLAALVATVR
jgi:hypothetical protein